MCINSNYTNASTHSVTTYICMYICAVFVTISILVTINMLSYYFVPKQLWQHACTYVTSNNNNYVYLHLVMLTMNFISLLAVAQQPSIQIRQGLVLGSKSVKYQYGKIYEILKPSSP